MYRKVSSLYVLLGLLLTFPLLLGPGMPVVAIPEQEGTVSQEVTVLVSTISDSDQMTALSFWTREMIAEVQPMEMPAQFGPATIHESALVQPKTTRVPGVVPSGLAASDADMIARAAYPRDWETLEETAVNQPAASMPTGTGQTYTSYTLSASALQTMYPHKWVGRLVFSTPNGTSYCSGTSIKNNIMVTAAHCVYDTTNNRWYSNWVLAPAYRNGNAPYGTFAATSCYVTTGWANLTGSYNIGTWARHDVAVCKMGKNSAGQTLSQAVGWAGHQWNWSYVRHFHDMGYPFKNYKNETIADAGKYLRTCIAESFQQAKNTRGMGCNWGGGISGGPWLIGYAPNVVQGYVDGVNSGIFVGTKNMYGARFNDYNIVVLCNAAGCN